MPLVALLLMLAAPLARRILISLGFGIITYAGLTLAFNAARDQVVAYYGQAGADITVVADLAGLPQAFGIMLGACAARIALMAVQRLGMLGS